MPVPHRAQFRVSVVDIDDEEIRDRVGVRLDIPTSERVASAHPVDARPQVVGGVGVQREPQLLPMCRFYF